MKDHVDKLMGIVTLIPEDLVKIKPLEPLGYPSGQRVGNETDQIPLSQFWQNFSAKAEREQNFIFFLLFSFCF